MIIYPAIDIMDGVPVRLYQGDYQKREVVASKVDTTMKQFAEAGCQYVHVVDLDGAKDGHPVNTDVILKAIEKIGLKAEVGGGIRTMDDIALYLDHGADKVILGTAALENTQLLKNALSAYGERIAVGIDCRNGSVRTGGWLKDSGVSYLSFAKEMEKAGVKNIICTDISTDGTLQGPNVKLLEDLRNHVSCHITASGGIHALKDIQVLKEAGMYAAIIGKALYSGVVDLKQALAIAEAAE